MKIAMIGWEYPPFKVGGLGTHCYGLTRSLADIGVFYKVKKPVFHKELYGDWNPVKKKQNKRERLKIVEEFLQPKNNMEV